MPNKTHYVLVDYENVQPAELELLDASRYKIKVFLGPHQVKAKTKRAWGENVEFVQLDAPGKNALDFHLACYLGQLAALDTTAIFHVVAKDKGYDALIRHLRSKGIRVQRQPSVTGLPTPLPPLTPQAEVAVAHLISMKASRPRRRTTLLGTLRHWFAAELSPTQLTEMLALLRDHGIVKEDGTKVSYTLPAPAKIV